MENLETALEPEGTRTKLKRELRAEAMTRLEEAARTEADFENVVACWDKLDANRERKERYHEPIQGDMAMEYELKYNGKLFPEWMCGANYQLYFCPAGSVSGCDFQLSPRAVRDDRASDTVQNLSGTGCRIQITSLLYGCSGLDAADLCSGGGTNGQECAEKDDPADEQNSKRVVHGAVW